MVDRLKGVIRENRQKLLEGGIADSRVEVVSLGAVDTVGFVALSYVTKQLEYLRNINDMQNQIANIGTYEGTSDENRYNSRPEHQ